MRLDGKVAVVTGAAGDGIGRAIAASFAREGASIAVIDLRPLQRPHELTSVTGQPALGLEADVADPAQLLGCLEQVAGTLGPVDVLVNGAAVLRRRPFLELTLADWDELHAVDLRAAFVASQWTARALVERGRPGSIINIASVGGSIATREQAHYCAAKGGLVMLTRGMALELAEHGIRVNAISPGAVETDLNRHLLADPDFRALRAGSNPLGRVGTPAEIAPLAVLLASDEASFVTGADLVADGGQTIW